jgi:N-formylglutamate deformylase
VELVRRYGRPHEHRHSVQLEVNRRLYMHEETFEITDGFATLQRDLQSLVQTLLATDPRTLA